MVDIQFDDRSMWNSNSPEESWARKISSPTRSEDSGIEWSPNPYNACCDSKMELETPFLRHHVANKSGEFAEISENSFGLVGNRIPDSFPTEDLQWKHQIIQPGQNLPNSLHEKTSFNKVTQQSPKLAELKEFSGTSYNLNNLTEGLSISPTCGQKQSAESGKRTKVSSKVRMNSRNSGTYRKHKTGPPTVRELLDARRKQQQYVMDPRKCFYDDSRRVNSTDHMSYTACPSQTFHHPMSISNYFSNSTQQKSTGMHQRPYMSLDDLSTLHQSDGYASSQSVSHAEFSPTTSNHVYSNSWSSFSMLNVDLSTSTHYDSSHANQCVEQSTSTYGLPQIAQVFRTENEPLSSVSRHSYSAFDTSQLPEEEAICSIQTTPTTNTSFQNDLPFNNYDPSLIEFFNSVLAGDANKLQSQLTCNPQYANAVDENGKVPLFYAIEHCQLEAIKLLRFYQADLNFVSQDGNTVLHYAARCPQENVLNYLLNCLLPEEALSLICKAAFFTGSTSLHEAANFKLSKNLLILLKFGADLLAQDKRGMTALHIAVQSCDYLCVDTLIKFAANPTFCSNIASSRNISTNCLASHLDVMLSQATFHHEWTSLHFAAASLHDLNPLQISIRHKIIDLLLQNNANPCVTNSEGNTPEQLLPSSTTSDEISAIYQLFSNARQRRMMMNEHYLAPSEFYHLTPPQNQIN